MPASIGVSSPGGQPDGPDRGRARWQDRVLDLRRIAGVQVS